MRTFFLRTWISVGLVVFVAGFTAFAATGKATRPKESSAPQRKSGGNSPTTISQDPYIGAIAIDAATGKVLFEEGADAKAYPASTLKLMDMLIILEKIRAGQLSLQDQVPVSARASGVGGTQVYLKEKESFTVEEMLYALMIQSANDAAVALAEKVSGTTEAFLDLMNARARQLGMANTVCHSVHGLPPGKGQEHSTTSARDFAILARELVTKHPEVLKYTSQKGRVFRPEVPTARVVMQNHNNLLGKIEGCDGLKTGYIRAGGFCIVLTADRNGKRVIAVVMGSKDRLVRDAKAAQILAKAFNAL